MANATITIDKAGRLVLPKALRDELGLAPGDTPDVRSEGDCITLRPARSAQRLQKERGIWVFRSGEPIAAAITDRVLRETRERRDRDAPGSEI